MAIARQEILEAWPNDASRLQISWLCVGASLLAHRCRRPAWQPGREGVTRSLQAKISQDP
jgi:hypothetical protein